MTLDEAWDPSQHQTLPFLTSEAHSLPGTANDWDFKKVQVSHILTTLLLVAFIYTFNGGTALYRVLFFGKSIILCLKEIMHRFTGVLRPGGVLANKSGATPFLNSTGLSSLAHRMFQQKPVGLGNFDFSCYQNSVIQGLSSLVSLPRFLNHVIGDEQSTKSVTAAVLRETLETLNLPQDQRMIWLPRVLKSMSSMEQQDAQEYYAKILDQVDKEEIAQNQKLRQAKGLASLNGGLDSHGKSTSSDAEELARPKNPLEGLIAQRVGCLKCGHSDGISMIPFNCLTVPLPPYNACHLAECLDEYTNLEYIEGVECPKCTLLSLKAKLEMILAVQQSSALQNRLTAVQAALDKDDFSDETLKDKCDLPKKLWSLTTKSKQSVIGRPPKCLVVHVNRSRFDEQTFALYKDHANVRFPLAFDLGPWCVNELASESAHSSKPSERARHLPDAISDPRSSMLLSDSNGPASWLPPSDWQYELRAAIIHHGRHENGHYICYRKYPPTQSVEPQESSSSSRPAPSFLGWWELSDDDVARVSERTVQQQGQAFMLFYELIADSVGKDDAMLRIASCTPLPRDIETLSNDAILENMGEHDSARVSTALQETIGRPIPAEEAGMESTTSSEEESPNLEANVIKPTASFPKMATGIAPTSKGDEALGRAVKAVDVI